jgi:hypothetical protein
LVRAYFATKSKYFVVTFLIIGISCLLAGVVGFVGMFFFWPQAPFIYFSGVASKILFSPLLPVKNPRTVWENMCGEIELFLDGLLMALVFFGPAKNLFFQ